MEPAHQPPSPRNSGCLANNLEVQDRVSTGEDFVRGMAILVAYLDTITSPTQAPVLPAYIPQIGQLLLNVARFQALPVEEILRASYDLASVKEAMHDFMRYGEYLACHLYAAIKSSTDTSKQTQALKANLALLCLEFYDSETIDPDVRREHLADCWGYMRSQCKNQDWLGGFAIALPDIRECSKHEYARIIKLGEYMSVETFRECGGRVIAELLFAPKKIRQIAISKLGRKMKKVGLKRVRQLFLESKKKSKLLKEADVDALRSFVSIQIFDEIVGRLHSMKRISPITAANCFERTDLPDNLEDQLNALTLHEQCLEGCMPGTLDYAEILCGIAYKFAPAATSPKWAIDFIDKHTVQHSDSTRLCTKLYLALKKLSFAHSIKDAERSVELVEALRREVADGAAAIVCDMLTNHERNVLWDSLEVHFDNDDLTAGDVEVGLAHRLADAMHAKHTVKHIELKCYIYCNMVRQYAHHDTALHSMYLNNSFEGVLREVVTYLEELQSDLAGRLARDELDREESENITSCLSGLLKQLLMLEVDNAAEVSCSQIADINQLCSELDQALGTPIRGALTGLTKLYSRDYEKLLPWWDMIFIHLRQEHGRLRKSNEEPSPGETLQYHCSNIMLINRFIKLHADDKYQVRFEAYWQEALAYIQTAISLPRQGGPSLPECVEYGADLFAALAARYHLAPAAFPGFMQDKVVQFAKNLRAAVCEGRIPRDSNLRRLHDALSATLPILEHERSYALTTILAACTVKSYGNAFNDNGDGDDRGGYSQTA